MRNRGAFTLIEIVITIFILVMLTLLAVPSLNGVIANNRLHRSLDGFNALVHEAQERSVAEHRSYLIVWADKSVSLRPEAFAKDEEHKAVSTFTVERGSELKLTLPAALTKNPPGQWIFWPTGTREPAIVEFKGRDGAWTANFSALTARGELLYYAAR